ncbi:MAG: UDP-3-O-[3-hydroxymyristoyl] N-acetylglucosamine deacetylase [Planctomycetes bacterium]|nr:UDP-3-O-[3-hydroxymyristoyl] N-acetylglucosamine deacetylase [Planctomycetota bacterium]
MKPRQTTIQKAVELTGVGVNLGRPVTVRILPAPPDSGVTFVRVDLPGAQPIPASPDFVVPKLRRTVLRRGDAEVQMTEHVLAAASGLELDNLRVELKGAEFPAGDGSAQTFSELIQKAGIAEQDRPLAHRTIAAPITISDETSTMTALPATEGLSVSYTLEYPSLSLPAQHVDVRVTPEVFLRELAPARTFVFQREAPALLASGLGRGASLENTLVLRDDGSLIYGHLRFHDEFARHKIVDLLGDLRLLGGGLAVRIIAARSGHAQNFQLIEQVRTNLVTIQGSH